MVRCLNPIPGFKRKDYSRVHYDCDNQVPDIKLIAPKAMTVGSK